MPTMNKSPIWDAKLIEKYNYSGPRYTSYPTALEFNDDYSESDFILACNTYPTKDLSLYIHIPFCHKLCYFCACNRIVTKNDTKVSHYLDSLICEINAKSTLFYQRNVTQMHWGGGTPTFLTHSQIERLNSALRKAFHFNENAEISIEIDPRRINVDTINFLSKQGFNRLSMGIQDFNPEIQQLINRSQDEMLIHDLIERARALDFNSISLDLIYGLPKQTESSFLETLSKIVALSPDRLSIFNYAHLPSRFAAQRKIKDHDLPLPDVKLAILQSTIAYLTENGYHYIGMDHFAKPTDELAIAQQQGTLHRNFQGYTTQQNTDLLGLGVSAISMMGDHYSQNQKELSLYEQDIEQKKSAISKGVTLTRDDIIRRDLIKQLICHFKLAVSEIESLYLIDFNDYFSEDLQLLSPLIADELLIQTDNELIVTDKGRLLIRNICMCFDVYMRKFMRSQQFSRII